MTTSTNFGESAVISEWISSCSVSGPQGSLAATLRNHSLGFWLECACKATMQEVLTPMQKGLKILALASGGLVTGYMLLAADFGEKEHIFSPVSCYTGIIMFNYVRFGDGYPKMFIHCLLIQQKRIRSVMLIVIILNCVVIKCLFDNSV